MIAFQTDLRPVLPVVYSCADYTDFRQQLEQIDRLIVESGLESRLVEAGLARWKEGHAAISPRQEAVLRKQFHHALRCNVARHLTGESYRLFSVRLADSALLQWFTHTPSLDGVRPPSKSALERYDKLFSVQEVRSALEDLLGQVFQAPGAKRLLGREEAVSVRDVFADCTCVKANIHFPVDWVLLRDAARTLIAAIRLIRAQGLKHRMPEPSGLLKEMNRLCIRMTHSRRRLDSRAVRNAVLREMKKLSRTIESHAVRYRQMLMDHWPQTDWSEAEARQVLNRMQHVLSQLPAAIHQAHERIIGERPVANREKILSLYEDRVHVLVRGKAGAEVEFGNGLYLAEQNDGLIVDWAFFEDQPKADSTLVKASLERITGSYGPIGSLTGDRGFDSRANAELLESAQVFNAICPKDAARHHDRTQEPRFMKLQTRRGQTEARIAIFKNTFLGRPMRNKGFGHRHNTVAWCVLTHNLWVLSRMAQAQEALRPAA